MRDERERSGEESTMPAPEKRGATHDPFWVTRVYPTWQKRESFSGRQKAPYAEGGCNGFLA